MWRRLRKYLEVRANFWAIRDRPKTALYVPNPRYTSQLRGGLLWVFHYNRFRIAPAPNIRPLNPKQNSQKKPIFAHQNNTLQL
jgi:hypothetical protein